MLGSKFAHYEITNHLGTGGMGEVYQATDTKLGRNVAIKLLPAAFANDAERSARFEREARVLASLNHPNIAAIYGVDESGGRKFLVMELVEGQTLAGRIARGAIPLDECLSIAGQIAEALEAAHEKGIIHRDLKPANVKITSGGKVKVLDFGLAKAFEGDAENANLTNSPTISIAATNAGTILGTAAYMSPEQAKGAAVDRRTDIFALGCVLYELLCGHPAFAGETVGDILAAVIRAEPNWSRLPLNTPPGIRRLLRRCLHKDRSLRLQAAGDVRIDIVDAVAEPELAAPPPAASRTRERLLWIVALLAGMAAVGLGLRYLRPPVDEAEIRLDIATTSTSEPGSFALSPDGKWIVYRASVDGQPRLWLRALDKTEPRPLAGTERGDLPFWSPDSRSIGFFADSRLRRLDIGSGSAQTLAATSYERGGTWSAGNIILFAPNPQGPLFRVSAAGGETAVAVTKVEEYETGHRFPQFLPDGRQFLFYVQGTPAVQGIYLGSLDSKDTKRLTAADTSGAYLPSGWVLFVRQGILVARRLDLSRKELTSGDSAIVADGLQTGTVNVGAFSASASGLVAYRMGGMGGRQLTWFDRSGKTLGVLNGLDENGMGNPEVSPDGQTAVIDKTLAGNGDVWLRDASRTSRFTTDASIDSYAIWSADGRHIVFRSNRKGAYDLYEKAVNGSASEVLLLESPQAKTPYDWSPDGHYLLYGSIDQKAARDLWVLPLDGEGKPNGKPIVFLNSKFDELNGQFSPKEGKWVAYQSNESGQFEIYVRPFPESGGSQQISTLGGTYPRWRHDGKELYYIALDGKLMAVSITWSGATLVPGPPTPLFQPQIVSSNQSSRAQYDVASDGRFLISVGSESAAVSPIRIILNWKPPSK